jgi:hypothetical protein
MQTGAGNNIRLVEGRPSGDVAILAAQVSDLASLFGGLRARGRFAALVWIKMGSCSGAVSIWWNWLRMDVVHWGVCQVYAVIQGDHDRDLLNGVPVVGRPLSLKSYTTPFPSGAEDTVTLPCTLAVAGRVATKEAPFGLFVTTLAGVAWALTSAMLERVDKITDDRIFEAVILGDVFGVAQAFGWARLRALESYTSIIRG